MQVVEVVSNTTDDNSADSPEHLKHLSRRGSELERHDLGTVGGRVGDKHAPRNTLEELRDQDDGERVGEVEDEDEGIEKHEAENRGPSVSDSAGDGTGDNDTNDGTDGTDNLKGRLPLGLNDPLLVLVTVDTVSLGESGQGDEVADEEKTVSLHNLGKLLVICENSMSGIGGLSYNCARHVDSPERSRRVGSDSLENGHVVLLVLGIDGALHVHLLLGLDIVGMVDVSLVGLGL